jgi:hypothetical protein
MNATSPTMKRRTNSNILRPRRDASDALGPSKKAGAVSAAASYSTHSTSESTSR